MFRVDNLSKCFRLYNRPVDRLKEILLRRSYHSTHQALAGISFGIERGEALAILGRNGAGKSTLLKIITGVLLADTGSVTSDARVLGLLELGTGFDHNQSGLKNIEINGLLIGMTAADIERHRQAIIEFSELGDFIKEPVRTYSSGMVMRLAFSIAIHAMPDILVVDEALSVGDIHFQQKCMHRIKAFKADGGAIIFVSHDLHAVKMLCDRAIVLDRGNVIADGEVEDAVNFYNRLMADQGDESFTLNTADTGHVYGDGQAVIVDHQITGLQSGTSMVTSGEETLFEFRIRSHANLENVTLGMMIRDRFGQDVFGVNSFLMGESLSLRAGQELTCCYRLPLDLNKGKYSLSAALHTQDHHLDDCYYWNDKLGEFEISGYGKTEFSGICFLNPRLYIDRTAQSLIEVKDTV